ncbi:MAG: twin-arginine translocase subunit TatC [Candidatus Edwardsbacteria bacterium]
MSSEEKEMPFFDHLEELRRRLLFSLLFITVFSLAGWFFSPQIISFLLKPVGKLYFFSVLEAFTVRLKISIIVGFALSTPFLLYQAIRFIFPALRQKERHLILPLVVFSLLLFLAGIAFGYFLVFPVGLRVLLSFGGGQLEPLLGVSRYLSFVLWFLLAFGLSFQLPLIIFFLVKLGVITPLFLRQQRKVAIVLAFIMAALGPTTDLLSQVLMVVPLILLYEAGLWLSYLGRKYNYGDEKRR